MPFYKSCQSLVQVNQICQCPILILVFLFLLLYMHSNQLNKCKNLNFIHGFTVGGRFHRFQNNNLFFSQRFTFQIQNMNSFFPFKMSTKLLLFFFPLFWGSNMYIIKQRVDLTLTETFPFSKTQTLKQMQTCPSWKVNTKHI